MQYIVVVNYGRKVLGTVTFSEDNISVGDSVEVPIDDDFREYRVIRKVYTNSNEKDDSYDFQHVRLYCYDDKINREGRIE